MQPSIADNLQNGRTFFEDLISKTSSEVSIEPFTLRAIVSGTNIERCSNYDILVESESNKKDGEGADNY